MGDVKFYVKEKKEKEFVLVINEHRFTLCSPSIQPFNEYFIESIEDILYYYYNVKIEELYSIGRPKTITILGILEFGAIRHLSEFIDDVLNFNIFSLKDKDYRYKKVGNKIVEDESFWSISKKFKCEGMLREDCYYITKTGIHRDEVFDYKKDKTEKNVNEITYDLYIGGGNDEINSNITGVNMTVTEEDLKIVKQWAEEFVNYSISYTKNSIDEIFNTDYDDVDDENKDCYYYPYLLKKHLKEKYPEDMDKFREIYIKLYNESMILEEYYKYIKGEEIEEPLFSKWSTPFTAKQYIDEGLKDWEAYLKIYDEYKQKLK